MRLALRHALALNITTANEALMRAAVSGSSAGFRPEQACWYGCPSAAEAVGMATLRAAAGPYRPVISEEESAGGYDGKSQHLRRTPCSDTQAGSAGRSLP